MLLGLIIVFLIAVWVYSDAKARGEAQPGLWAVGTFLLAIIVLPVWLIKRPPKREALQDSNGLKRCPFCAEDIKLAAVVCKHCHRELPAA